MATLLRANASDEDITPDNTILGTVAFLYSLWHLKRLPALSL
jgi:hypothetical protein